MSNDPASGSGVPDPVREWLAGLAEERDVATEELVAGLLADDGDATGSDGWVNAAELVGRVEALESAIEELDAEIDEKVGDVRERVIQVKRETDGKAPTDHDHPRLSTHVERQGEQLDDVAQSLEDVSERVDAVDDRMDAGFSNFEEVLEYLLDTTDALDDKVRTLARATLDVRERAERVAAAEAERAAADRLRASANEHGVRSADCGACGGTVYLGLLGSPDCPHCAARFTAVEPRTGFFRSSVLQTGERPALEGEVRGEGEPPDLASLLEANEGTTTSVDGPSEAEPSPPGSDDLREATDERSEPAGTRAADEGLDSVSGIGPAYEERLRSAGVETVGDLALADSARLARETDIASSRLERLVRRARERVESE